MITIDVLKSTVKEFHAKFTRPGIDELVISGPYDLKVDWPNAWPCGGQAGVYALADEAGEVKYIGKASCNATIGARFGSYWHYDENRDAKPQYEWLNSIRYVYVIGMPEGHEFEAPAIEEYLVSNLNPSLNVVGKKHIDI
jgi:hypothetical protein